MFASVWPLVILLILDFLGIWGVAARVLSGSITKGIEGAYLACGLLILQIPLCLVGIAASRKAKHIWLTRVYIGHIVFSVAFCAIADTDPTDYLTGCANLLLTVACATGP